MGASYGGQVCVRLQRKLVCCNSRFYQPGTEAVVLYKAKGTLACCSIVEVFVFFGIVVL